MKTRCFTLWASRYLSDPHTLFRSASSGYLSMLLLLLARKARGRGLCSVRDSHMMHLWGAHPWAASRCWWRDCWSVNLQRPSDRLASLRRGVLVAACDDCRCPLSRACFALISPVERCSRCQHLRHFETQYCLGVGE